MYFEYKFICIQKRKEEKNGFRKADMLIFCCRFFLKGVRKDLIKLKKKLKLFKIGKLMQSQDY